CHVPQPEVWDRTNGRIYKISYRGTKPVAGIDLQKCTDEQLVKYQLDDNEWFVRHARRILQERAAAGGLKDKATPQAALEEITLKNPDAGRRLRGLWAMYGINALTGFTALQPVSDQDEHVRGWAVRLLGDDKAGVPNGADYVWKGLTTRARQESSPLVRRELASLVLRL